MSSHYFYLNIEIELAVSDCGELQVQQQVQEALTRVFGVSVGSVTDVLTVRGSRALLRVPSRQVWATGVGGKDVVMVASRAELSSPSAACLPEPEPAPGLLLPDGSINWGCPCLGGMATGPCGTQFRDAFSCFHYSEADPKGSDCYEKFSVMQECMSHYPELYGKDDDEDLAAAMDGAAGGGGDNAREEKREQGEGGEQGAEEGK